MEYIIIKEYSPEDLIKTINAYLKNGWELQGSPFTASFAYGQGWVSHVCQVDHTIFLTFHQAMVRASNTGE